MLDGGDITVAAVGNTVETALKAADMAKACGIGVEVINARFVKPLDLCLIQASANKTGKIITIEDNTIKGGFGAGVLEGFAITGVKADIKLMGFPDVPILQGSRNSIYKKYCLDADSLFLR